MSASLTYSVLDPMTPDEGVEALETLVGGSLTRVGVGRLRLDRAVVATPAFRDLGFFEQLVAGDDTTGAGAGPAGTDWQDGAAVALDWSQIPAEDRQRELEIRLQAVLARELRMPAAAVDVDKPFPELGLDSMMAMTVLKETQRLVGMDLSATMLWNNPTISALAAFLAEVAAPQETEDEIDADLDFESAGSVLDELFESVETGSSHRESSI